MPNIKSAKKRVRISEKENARNRALRSNLRTSIKKADTAISENAADKDALVKAAVVTIDKSVTKGIIHKNNAARKKSRLLARAAQATE